MTTTEGKPKPFDYFEVAPSGQGAGKHIVKCWPRMGFWEFFGNGDFPPYDPDSQREFIEAAIREKMEREQP